MVVINVPYCRAEDKPRIAALARADHLLLQRSDCGCQLLVHLRVTFLALLQTTQCTVVALTIVAAQRERVCGPQPGGVRLEHSLDRPRKLRGMPPT